jgi:hypothetical protein
MDPSLGPEQIHSHLSLGESSTGHVDGVLCLHKLFITALKDGLDVHLSKNACRM